MAKVLYFLIFVALAWQVHTLELENVKNDLRKLFSDSKEEEVETESKCPKDGYYENKRDCSTFIKCTNGRAVAIDCPQGYHFRNHIKKCMRVCDAHCDKTLACKCEWETCGSKETCQLPSVTGPCNANMLRFYFDLSSGECKAFVYGGCDGNENNFESKKDCQEYCDYFTNVCNLPFDRGCFIPILPRYFYNNNTGKCEMFLYSGCGGNTNNFPSQEHCELKCKKAYKQRSELTCPEPDGDFPYHLDCKKHISCKDGKPKLKKCPSKLAFDFLLRKCVPVEEAVCAR